MTSEEKAEDEDRTSEDEVAEETTKVTTEDTTDQETHRKSLVSDVIRLDTMCINVPTDC